MSRKRIRKAPVVLTPLPARAPAKDRAYVVPKGQQMPGSMAPRAQQQERRT